MKALQTSGTIKIAKWVSVLFYFDYYLQYVGYSSIQTSEIVVSASESKEGFTLCFYSCFCCFYLIN